MYFTYFSIYIIYVEKLLILRRGTNNKYETEKIIVYYKYERPSLVDDSVFAEVQPQRRTATKRVLAFEY